MDYFVRHRTTYRYVQDVSQSWHIAHLTLRDTPLQRVAQSVLSFDHEVATRIMRPDYFGNPCEWFSFDQPHTHLEILAESRVTVDPAPERASRDSLTCEAVRASLEAPSDDASRDAVQFLFDSPMTAFKSDIASYARESFPANRPLLAGAMELMHRIHADFRYDTTVTDATTPVDQVFEIRAGVCQDLAHVGIASLRSIGLPARYVSGYLLTHPPAGMPRLIGSDASHAWFSVFAPPFGWVDLDPTNAVIVSDGHVTAAWGRDYGDVAPVAGIILGGNDHVIDVAVDVIPD
jgi:transglutaminase-like putative cysteine protease